MAKSPLATGLHFVHCISLIKQVPSALGCCYVCHGNLYDDWFNRGVDKCFSKFEINKNAVDKEMLILYFDKITHKEDLCLKFNLHQYFEVGFIQPASVTVYEYYAKENRCTQFYHVEKDSKHLGRICVGDVCRCSEENCFMQQQMAKVDSSVRYAKACDVAVDYVYKTTLSAIKEAENYVTYVMTIKSIFKEGRDPITVNKERDFISHVKCKKALNLVIGQDYLAWGVAKDLWFLASKYSYMITKDSWIEMWPKDKQCQESQYEQLCSELFSMSEELQLQGCH
ncbi:complement C3-like [Mantella aurantiaca]